MGAVSGFSFGVFGWFFLVSSVFPWFLGFFCWLFYFRFPKKFMVLFVVSPFFPRWWCSLGHLFSLSDSRKISTCFTCGNMGGHLYECLSIRFHFCIHNILCYTSKTAFECAQRCCQISIYFVSCCATSIYYEYRSTTFFSNP